MQEKLIYNFTLLVENIFNIIMNICFILFNVV